MHPHQVLEEENDPVYILGDLPSQIPHLTVSMTRDMGEPVSMAMDTHPLPDMYRSMILSESSSSNVMQFLRFLTVPDAQERVLHFGHLRGVFPVRENHECPQTRHVFVNDSPNQW